MTLGASRDRRRVERLTFASVKAPTLWEEGTTTGGRVARLAVLSCALLGILDVLVLGRLTALFDIGYVLVAIGAALAVRPRDFFTAGVLPPFLLLGVLLVLAVIQPGAIAGTADGVGQALIAGLAHHSGALFAANMNALVVLGIRHRIMAMRRDQHARRTSPYAVGREESDYPNLEASPAPTLVTTGAPEEKSTTVVGSEMVEPESRTASSF